MNTNVKKTKVVNFISGAGAGKSLISSLVYAELKMMHKSVEIVPEVAKWLIYRGELEKLNDQYYVSSEQYKMIKALDGKVEYVIGDSGIFTGMYYNRAYKSNMSDIEKVEKMIWTRNNEFQNIYIYLERNTEYPFENEGRVHNEEESKVVDIELKEMLKEFNIPYKSVLSHRDNVQEIVDYILSHTS
jgi:nicotinamide riboside kinase